MLYSSFTGVLTGSVVKNLPANAGDAGSMPVLGRIPGGGNGTPVQFTYQENPMEGEGWQATAHAVIEQLDIT